MGQFLDIFGASKARKAQEKAADKSIAASTAATDKTLALQREMFDRVWAGTAVQRDAGDAATRMMSQLMGLQIPGGAQGPAAPAGQPQPQVQPALTQEYPAAAGSGMGGGSNALMDFGTNDMALAAGEGGSPMRPMANALGAGQTPQVLPGQPGAPQVQPAQPGQPATGGNALNPTDWLRSTPGYRFNFDEGARAMNTRLAGQGRLQSGDASREAIRYGQNYGDRIYADQFNRLAGIAGTGQVAQGQSQQAGQSYANNSSNALQWNANNLASSYGQKANATAGFWGDMTGRFGSDAIARYAGQFMKGGM